MLPPCSVRSELRVLTTRAGAADSPAGPAGAGASASPDWANPATPRPGAPARGCVARAGRPALRLLRAGPIGVLGWHVSECRAADRKRESAEPFGPGGRFGILG